MKELDYIPDIEADALDLQKAESLLLEDLGFSRIGFLTAKSLEKEGALATLFKLVQVSLKLEQLYRSSESPKTSEVLMQYRIRIQAQKFIQESKEMNPLKLIPATTLKTDAKSAEKVKNRLSRIEFLAEQLKGTDDLRKTSRELRLKLAKAALEDMGDDLEKIADSWAAESGLEKLDCADTCFSYFAIEVKRQFPETGWLNIPVELSDDSDYKDAKMHKFVEFYADELKEGLARRSGRMLKTEIPAKVKAQIDALIADNQEKLEF